MRFSLENKDEFPARVAAPANRRSVMTFISRRHGLLAGMAGAWLLAGNDKAAAAPASKEVFALHPDPSIADHTSAIQEKINACARAGGGRVELAAGVFRCNSGPLYLDPTKTSLMGDGAVLDFSAASGAAGLVITTPASAPSYGQATQRIAGIALRGPGLARNMAGIIFRTEIPGRSSRISLLNLDISGFFNGVQFEDRAYLIQFYNIAIRNCVNCVMTLPKLQDAGENISFFGCTLSASRVAIHNLGGFELNFFATSLDFTAQWFNGNGLVNFYGCHLEMAAPLTTHALCNVTGDGVLQFHGGTITVSGNSFAALPKNQTVFQLHGVRSRAVLVGTSVYNLRSAGGSLAAGAGRLILQNLQGGPQKQLAPVPMRAARADLFGGAGKMSGNRIRIEADLTSDSTADSAIYQAKYGSMALHDAALVIRKSGGTGNALRARFFCPVRALCIPAVQLQWKIFGTIAPGTGPVWATLNAVQKIGVDPLGRAVIGATEPMGALQTLPTTAGGAGWAELSINNLEMQADSTTDGCVSAWATHLCISLELINLPAQSGILVRNLVAYGF